MTDTCYFCGSQIYSEHRTWIDNSGGDVCGTHADNHPHTPALDGETSSALAVLVREQAEVTARNAINSSTEVDWLLSHGWTATDIATRLSEMIEP